MIQIQGRQRGGGGGQGGKIPGAGLIWGPEILIIHLVVVLL